VARKVLSGKVREEGGGRRLSSYTKSRQKEGIKKVRGMRRKGVRGERGVRLTIFNELGSSGGGDLRIEKTKGGQEGRANRS